MFDTSKVATNIKTARTRMNMTQMDLADEMGVSYQAVSNWERGNSMPDISKLPELCKILNITFEELVGEKSIKTEVAEKLMQDEDADVTLEEMAQVGALVKPDKLEKKVEEAIEKEEKISFSTLVGLAPFMDKESLGKLAEELADVDTGKLVGLAPFLSRETLDKLIENGIRSESINTNHIVALAPFLHKETVGKLAEYLIAHGQSNKLVALAPFMGKNMFPNSLKNISITVEGNQVKTRVETAENADETEGTSQDWDDLDEEQAAKLAFRALEKDEDFVEYLDYMDEDDVARFAMRALELGKDVVECLDYMDEDDVARFAMQALELGKDVVECLDYMDEDDIAKLAVKAVEAGKDIEPFLDYLDEDVIKSMLLRALRK